jgi:hypothetical protein
LANAGKLRDLYECCGVRVLARIDPRIGSLDINPVDSGRIELALNKALALGKDAIVGFEGPNEYTAHQNGPGWDRDLRSFMERLYTVIKADRKLPQPVVGPTIYLTKEMHIKQLGNISAFVDGFNTHVYPRGYEPSTPIVGELIRVASAMAPREPGWVTEYGYHNTIGDPSSNPVSELAAAKYLPRLAVLLFKRSPRGKHYFYEFIDQGNNKAGREDNFGLLRFDGSRKPAFHTLRRLLTPLRAAAPIAQPKALEIGLSGAMSNVSSLLLQKASDRYLVLLWQEVQSWDTSRQKLIAFPTKKVTVTLPVAARLALSDTLPSLDEPSRSAPLVRFPGTRRTVTIDVPDHIVVLEVQL